MAWKRGTAQPLARDRVLVQRNDRIMPGSSQHPLQLLDPLQDLLLDRAQFGQDLQRWAVLNLGMGNRDPKQGDGKNDVTQKPIKELPIYFLGFLITWQFHRQI